MFWCFHCWLWTIFTHYSGVSIVGFEQLNTGWVIVNYFTSMNLNVLCDDYLWEKVFNLFVPLVWTWNYKTWNYNEYLQKGHCVKSDQIHCVNFCIQSEYGKIPTRKNFVFGHFLHSGKFFQILVFVKYTLFFVSNTFLSNAMLKLAKN